MQFLTGFECLFSKDPVTSNEELSFKKLIDFYTPEVENFDQSHTELKLWGRKLYSINITKIGLQAFTECDSNILYPNI